MVIFLLFLRSVTGCEELCTPCTAAGSDFTWNSCSNTYDFPSFNNSQPCIPSFSTSSPQVCTPNYAYCGVQREFATGEYGLRVDGVGRTQGLCVWRVDLRWVTEKGDVVEVKCTVDRGVVLVVAAYQLSQNLGSPLDLSAYSPSVYSGLYYVSLETNYL